MSWLRVNRCICGCNLKKGTLILLYLSVIGSVIVLLQEMTGSVGRRQIYVEQWFHTYNFFTALAALVVSTAGIYAVEEKIPRLMLPYIWYNVTTLVLGVLIIFTLPMIWSNMVNNEEFDDMLNEIAKEISVKHGENEKEAKEFLKMLFTNVVLPVIEIVLFIGTALHIYFSIVAYSWYKTALENDSAVVVA